MGNKKSAPSYLETCWQSAPSLLDPWWQSAPILLTMSTQLSGAILTTCWLDQYSPLWAIETYLSTESSYKPACWGGKKPILDIKHVLETIVGISSCTMHRHWLTTEPGNITFLFSGESSWWSPSASQASGELAVSDSRYYLTLSVVCIAQYSTVVVA